MDLSAIAAGQDLISFFLGLIASAVPLYKYLEKNQLIPKELQKEIQEIINAAEELENGYTSDEAQALGEDVIRLVAEHNQAAAKK
jgi:hypothetical protein